MNAQTPKISTDQLTPGAVIIVEGSVTYSRITKFVEGEELVRENQRKASRGMIPSDKPYTTIAIANAKIVPLNPNALTLEEQYVQSRFYNSKNDPSLICYQYENKSPYLPRISQAREGSANTFDQIVPQGELANGLKVMLIMTIYASKKFGKNALGLEQIVSKEPIRYYDGSNTAKALAQRGMTYVPLTPEKDKAAITPKETASTATAAATATAAPTAPTAPVAPVAPQANPYMNAPNPTPAPAPDPTPVQTAAPAMNPPEEPASPWVCQTCGSTVAANQGFCGACGAKRPTANTAVNTNPYGGIVYDPNN